MFQRPEALRLHLECRSAPRRVLDGHGDEIEADRQDHQPCHEGRKEEADAPDDGAKPEMDDASHEAGGQSDAEAFGGGNRRQHRDEGKTGSLHDWQAGSDRADANRLEESGDTRKEHGHLDEIDLFGAPEGKTCGTGNNNGGSDVGGEHRVRENEGHSRRA